MNQFGTDCLKKVLDNQARFRAIGGFVMYGSAFFGILRDVVRNVGGANTRCISGSD